MRFKLLLLATACLSTAAHADWKVATSKHFEVYSEGSEETLRKFTAKLEKYDFVLRTVSHVTAPSSPIKLKVYRLRDIGAVQDTLPYEASGIAGYYDASVRAPFAVVPRIETSDSGLEVQATLFHEYTHHFMFQYFPATYPTWYSEGFAEFYGNTDISDNDVVKLGMPAQGRYYSFSFNNWLPLDKLLTAKSYSDVSGRLHLLYAEGWLLVHYLSFDKERSGQLGTYLNEINEGHTYKEAMNDAFGPNAEALNDELRDYASRAKVTYMELPFKHIDVGKITIRDLSPSEEALLDADIRLNGGIPARLAADFAEDVRSTAAQYPDDPYALRILIEAERAAGNSDAAKAAVEHLLAVHPNDPKGLMHKAELQFEQLRKAKTTDPKAWNAARQTILAANKAAPNDPQILLAYYKSYSMEGVLPPAPAQNALYQAFKLVPQDHRLRYRLAADFEKRGMFEDAITIISPDAFGLHGDDDEDPKKKKEREEEEEKNRIAGERKTETAREMLARLEKELAASQQKGSEAAGAANPS